MFDEQTAKNGLLGSANSYDNNSMGFSGYERIDLLEGQDGFNAHIYQNMNDSTDVVVALTGTEDLVDAFADANLGTNQWGNNGADLIERVSQINNLKKVTFSGHSLGGALAQFAAYDFLDESNNNGDVEVSLTTFNSLGGEEGIRQIEQDRDRTFDPTRLDNANAAHFVDTRDVVARLGNGHLGGDVIAHDFGSEDGLSAHKLDTSFLAGNNQDVLLIGDGTVVEQAYLDVSDGQSLAAGVANRFNIGPLESVTPLEATVGVLAAAEAMFLFAPTDELNELGQAFLPEYEHLSDWGDVRNLLLDPLTPLPNPDRVTDNINRAVSLNDAVLEATREMMNSGHEVVTEGIEQTAEGLKEIARAAKSTFDYMDEVSDEVAASLRDTTGQAYERAVEKTSEGIGRLVDAYESAEDFTLEKIDQAERFYDDTQQWVGEQIIDAADVIGRAHDTAVQNTSEFIEQIDDTYESLKEQSLDSAKEFVKDRLRDVTGLLRHAQDGLNEIAPTAGDFIRGARDSFLSSLPLPFIPVSPLVLDLDSDGYELSALDDSNVRFDLDADGFAEQTGWVQPDDALLVMDRNANGKIDNGSELFGDHTPVTGAPGTAPDGFSALSILDSNQDAILDQQDASFDTLRLWRDINQDGRSSPLELTSLADANIASIRLDAAATNQIIAGHNVALESTFTDTSGTEHAIGDILFEVDPVNAEFTGDYQLSVEALMLPLIRGYGGVPHLHIAMSQDPALLSRMQTIVAQGFSGSSNLVTEVEQLIIHWTGSENVDPDSRGQFVDARKLSALEAFMATPFVTTEGITDPGGNHAEQINLAWEELRTGILQRLVAQDLRGSPLSGATYEFATDTLSIGGVLSGFIESAKTRQPADSSDAIAYWHNISDFLRLSAGTLWVTEDTVEASLETGLADTELGQFTPVLFQPHLGGSTNSDTLHRANHYNLLTAGDGNDQLVSSGTGYRALFGGAGDDELRSEPLVVPATNFVGGTGQDTLIGSRYADAYHFNLGDGNDLIDETAGDFSSHQDLLYFGPGITREDVSVTRDDLDLVFDVGSNGDSIRVKEWYDRPGINGSDHRIESVVFEDGIWSVDDIHTTGLEVHGTDGDDFLSTLPYQEGNILHGEGGNDTLSAGPGSSDILHGGDGDDLLLGGDVSSDYLYGGAGNDELRSHPMNAFPTHLSGGTGDDLLVGSRRADAYHFNLGDGNDLIDETAGGFSSHNDLLYFGPGITREDVSVTRDDLDLIFDVGSNGDSIRVKEWYDRPGINGSDHRIESVVFEDGIWSVDDIHTTGLEVHGTDGDDFLSTLPYQEGNILHGEGGNDTLSAGPGSSDILHGGDGDDLLLGGDVSSDYLYGGAGNDELRSHPMNAFPTHLSGGTGDDLLVGSRRADAYHFNLGDGNDLIDETAGGFSSHNDLLYFGPGITREDVSVTRDDLDLVFDVGSNGDSIRVKEWYDRPGINGSDHRIESVVFEDGIWSVDDIHTTGLEVHGTDGDDFLSTLPYQEGNILHGEGGNDTLSAGPGSSDILHGGDGDDLLLGGDVSSDYLYGGAGNDELRSHPMNAFPTHLSGGTGDDLLVGSRRADAYYFNLGDGNDLIDETAGGFSSHNDLLYFGPGITREDVSVTRDDLDLIFDVGSNGDSIRVKEWYDRPGINGSDHRIESVVFEDGIWSVDDIHTTGLEVHGTDGDDFLSTLPYQEGNILHGEGGNDTLSAGPGSSDILHGGDGDDLLLGGDVSSDYLYGGAGNDELRSHPMNAFPTHLSGGTGDDLLVGSRRADAYYFNLGDGNDLIDETAGGFSSHNDLLYFGPGITREDVSVTRDDLDLIFDVGSNGDSIRVKEWYDRPGSNGGDRRIESVILDNRIWSAEEIEELAVENHPPTLNNPLADISTLALVPFEMTLDETMFSDMDQQQPLSLTVSRASSLSLPAWLTFDNELRRLSGTPSLADLQTMELVVTATDESYFSVSDSFDLTVSLPSGSVIAGTPQDDFVVGSSLDDVFVLDGGDDTLSGGDGDDSFVVLGPDLGVNIINGGSGFDSIKAGFIG